MNLKGLNIIWAPGKDYIIHQGHPESPARMDLFQKIIKEIGFELQTPLSLGRAELEKVQFISPETKLHPAHQMAAGAVKMGCARLLENQRALILARPPAHHSPRLSYGTRGFCTINNDAIGISHLLKTRPNLRLVVLDTDAHHGDGNEDFFFYEPRVKHFSIHQDGQTIFPGTGFPEVIGPFNNIFNIPLPPGAGNSFLYQAVTELVVPEIIRFAPDFIIHITGFDGHRADYLSALNYSDQILALISLIIKPDLTIIEGGYDLDFALPGAFPPLIKSLTQKDFSITPPPYSGKINRRLEEIRNIREKSSREQEENKNETLKRNISFFYDEAFFAEEREETFYPCKKCRGLIYIKSNCFTSREFLYTPENICPQCKKRKEALQKEKRAAPLIIRDDSF